MPLKVAQKAAQMWRKIRRSRLTHKIARTRNVKVTRDAKPLPPAKIREALRVDATADKKKWRKCMGIEPTDHTVNVRSDGFEDRGHHQVCKHFHALFYGILDVSTGSSIIVVLPPTTKSNGSMKTGVAL